ncbi:MAG: cytochrome C oxidase subunit IV family protein [Planctomycetota bacterium]
MSDSHAAEHHEHPPVPYFIVFGTLVVFTGITIGASFIDLKSKAANVSLAFAIAGFKASLVMFYFMHLKYEKRPIVAIALAPFALVMVLVAALMPDIAYGQYHNDDKLTTTPAVKEHHEAK